MKSINHNWNKRLAKHQSRLPKGVKTSKKIKNICSKRNRRVNDNLHKASRALVNELRKICISKVIIGYNKGWKENINLGKRNNQNFVQIPFGRFIQMITYKCMLVGIEVVLQEESYTSKCSFLDNESIEKHDSYAGKRVKRGLFMSSDGTLMNADANGAYNILNKHLGITAVQLDLVQVCRAPKVLKF